MPVTQQDIDTLNLAIRDGVRQVTLGGQTITYNTTASLIQARDDMQTQFNAQQAREAARRPNGRTLLYYGGRGYE